MKKKNSFILDTKYSGGKRKVKLVAKRDAGLMLYELHCLISKEPLARLNTQTTLIDEDEIWINIDEENEGIVEFLKSSGLIKERVRAFEYLLSSAPVHKLSDLAIEIINKQEKLNL